MTSSVVPFSLSVAHCPYSFTLITHRSLPVRWLLQHSQEQYPDLLTRAGKEPRTHQTMRPYVTRSQLLLCWFLFRLSLIARDFSAALQWDIFHWLQLSSMLTKVLGRLIPSTTYFTLVILSRMSYLLLAGCHFTTWLDSIRYLLNPCVDAKYETRKVISMTCSTCLGAPRIFLLLWFQASMLASCLPYPVAFQSSLETLCLHHLALPLRSRVCTLRTAVLLLGKHRTGLSFQATIKCCRVPELNAGGLG